MEECKQCFSKVDVHPLAGICKDCLLGFVEKCEASSSSKVSSELAPSKKKTWLLKGAGSGREIRTVAVAEKFGECLKPYQKEGAELIWKNCFSDCNIAENGDESLIGGYLLAHYMGLGKSLTTIAVLHTALTCPSLVSKDTGKPLFHTVLLIAPANTLTNWENEVEIWTRELAESLTVLNLGQAKAGYQASEIKKWKKHGGILVTSDTLFLRLADAILRAAQPDVVVLDEAHTMLKQSANKGFKKLQEIKTKRKILLSGTPLQNNVTEYFRMIEFMRPGMLGVESDQSFETCFRLIPSSSSSSSLTSQ